MIKKLFKLFKTQKPKSEKNGVGVVVYKKTKEEKNWSYLKDVTTDYESEYTALCDVAYQVTGSENPRINQASTPFSATVVLRKQGISYRFEIKRPSFNT